MISFVLFLLSVSLGISNPGTGTNKPASGKALLKTASETVPPTDILSIK